MQDLALFVSLYVMAAGLVCVIWAGAVLVVEWLATRRDRKRARIEAELDRTQAELRASILRLASELGADAHEARKALIRESFLATGRVSDRKD